MAKEPQELRTHPPTGRGRLAGSEHSSQSGFVPLAGPLPLTAPRSPPVTHWVAVKRGSSQFKTDAMSRTHNCSCHRPTAPDAPAQRRQGLGLCRYRVSPVSVLLPKMVLLRGPRCRPGHTRSRKCAPNPGSGEDNMKATHVFQNLSTRTRVRPAERVGELLDASRPDAGTSHPPSLRLR